MWQCKECSVAVASRSELLNHYKLKLDAPFTIHAEDEAVVQGFIEETTMGIYIIHDGSSTPEDTGIVVEGQQVLRDLDYVALAIAVLFGLTYALNLNYPPKLKYFFEVVQKVVMELDGTTLSKKAQVLKNRLYE